MGQFTIHNNRSLDATLISNRFIDFYMKDANDAQIKIYLYLVRMMNSNLPTSIGGIADTFNLTENDVIRSLNFWEKKQLLKLERNEVDAIVGISFKELKESTVENITQATTELPQIPANVITKDSYSLDEIKTFANSDDISELLFIIEQYIGKPLSPSNTRTILYINKELGLPTDLIDYLVEYCVERNKKDFNYIQAVAMDWAEKNITSVEEAKNSIQNCNNYIYGIMRELGQGNTTPTPREIEIMNKWKKVLGFSDEVISEACARAVSNCTNGRLKYANTVLENWANSNLYDLVSIEASDREYFKHKNTVAPDTITRKSTNKFNQFNQNEYDFDELEKIVANN